MKKSWYVIQVIAGCEKKVIQAIQDQAERKGVADHFEQIIAPSETFVEVRRGKKVNKEVHYFPGYVLAKVSLTDEIWQMILDIPRVSSLLGNKGKHPSPITETEVKRILGQVKDSKEKPRYTLTYEIGEQVRVTDGPFNTFTGSVEEVDVEKERLKVSVSIFGRPTPVDLGFMQVAKVK